MGRSLRVQQLLMERRRQREAERLAAEAEARAAAEAFDREWFNQPRAAEFLGISVHRLRRLMTAGRGPVSVKTGNTQQSPVRWHVDELRAFKADPDGYLAQLARE